MRAQLGARRQDTVVRFHSAGRKDWAGVLGARTMGGLENGDRAGAGAGGGERA